MNRHRRLRIPERLVVLLAAGLLGLAAPSCKRSDSANTYAPPPPPEVIVANPELREVTTYLRYTGTVEASETVELRARLQGFLEKVNFQPGQRVKAGDLLFVIDKRQFIAAVDQARASVESLKAALQGAENDARLARELADQRAGPEIDAVIKAARRDSTRADVARAEANLQDALLDLSYCEVTAPIDGRITRNFVDPGNLVGRGEPTLLATIVRSSPAFVSVDVNESDVLAVRRDLERSGKNLVQREPGQTADGQWRPCELALSDDKEFRIKGRIDYVAPEMNRETGTLLVRARFENADEALVPGYFALLRFPMSTRKALVVPEAALLTDQMGRYAMVVNADSAVEVRRVTIGELDGPMRVVESGLTPQDRVIVLGVLKARPGAKVAPKAQQPHADGH